MKDTLHEFLPAALHVELSYFIRKEFLQTSPQPECGELGGFTTTITTLRHGSAESGELCGNTTTIPTLTTGWAEMWGTLWPHHNLCHMSRTSIQWEQGRPKSARSLISFRDLNSNRTRPTKPSQLPNQWKKVLLAPPAHVCRKQWKPNGEQRQPF